MEFHLQIIPAKNDGPGIDLHPAEVANALAIPAPPQWYGLLPDMTYTWRVRVSDAPVWVALDHASWGPWAEAVFRTPKVGAITLVPITPLLAETVTTASPAIIFSNNRTDVCYFQLQVSKDPAFNDDPATASAPVYSRCCTAACRRRGIRTGIRQRCRWRTKPRTTGGCVPESRAMGRRTRGHRGTPSRPT